MTTSYPQTSYDDRVGAYEKRLEQLSGVDPVQLIMSARQYFEPIVRPLADEGAARFSDFMTGMDSYLTAPTLEAGASPSALLSGALGEVGRRGGQYDSVRNLLDYFGARAEELGKLGMQGYESQYGSALDLLKMGMQGQQGERDAAMEKMKFDEMVRQFNASMAGRGGNGGNGNGGVGDLVFNATPKTPGIGIGVSQNPYQKTNYGVHDYLGGGLVSPGAYNDPQIQQLIESFTGSNPYKNNIPIRNDVTAFPNKQPGNLLFNGARL